MNYLFLRYLFEGSLLPHPSSYRFNRKLFLLSFRRGGRESPGKKVLMGEVIPGTKSRSKEKLKF